MSTRNIFHFIQFLGSKRMKNAYMKIVRQCCKMLTYKTRYTAPNWVPAVDVRYQCYCLTRLALLKTTAVLMQVVLQ